MPVCVQVRTHASTHARMPLQARTHARTHAYTLCLLLPDVDMLVLLILSRAGAFVRETKVSSQIIFSLKTVAGLVSMS